MYERGLMALLEFYLDEPTAEFFSIKCQMSRGLLRSGILRNITKKDPQIAELIEYAMLHFARCYENRNILMHSKQYFGVELDFFLSLEKKPKGKEPLTFHLNLSTLRKVADDIMSGVFFISDIWRRTRQRSHLFYHPHCPIKFSYQIHWIRLN